MDSQNGPSPFTWKEKQQKSFRFLKTKKNLFTRILFHLTLFNSLSRVFLGYKFKLLNWRESTCASSDNTFEHSCTHNRDIDSVCQSDIHFGAFVGWFCACTVWDRDCNGTWSASFLASCLASKSFRAVFPEAVAAVHRNHRTHQCLLPLA